MLIRRRPIIARHDLMHTAGTTVYAALRNDGLPEVRGVSPCGYDYIISQKEVRLAVPPEGNWWEHIDDKPGPLPHLKGWTFNMGGHTV